MPEIDIEGYGKDNDDCKGRTVPLHILKSAKKFNINSPYQITKMAVYVVAPGFSSDNVYTSVLESNYFSNQILGALCHLQAGELVTLDDIKIKDSNGKEYSLELINFKITDD